MMKLLLIIMIFCPYIIKGLIEKFPISVKPDQCEVITKKHYFSDCKNGKKLSWLVRMNFRVKLPSLEFIEENTNNDFDCRNDCLRITDCLIIQQADKSCKKFLFTTDFEQWNNSDVLQLACCDKKKPEVLTLVRVIPAIGAQPTNQCFDNFDKNSCTDFPVWVVKRQFITYGRDISFRASSSHLCLDECNLDDACIGWVFDELKITCTFKYSLGFRSKDVVDIRLFIWQCCKLPASREFYLQTTTVNIRPEIKYMKDNAYKCPIGWSKRWSVDVNVDCKINTNNTTTTTTTNNNNNTISKCYESSADTFLSLCWKENCTFVFMDSINRICQLYYDNDDVQCLPSKSKSNQYSVYYMSCTKKIEHEDEITEVASPSNDCIFNETSSIGYDGKVDHSQLNNTCIDWSLTGMSPNFALKNQHNYCRNYNNDPRGPWCITLGHRLMEYCSPSKCAKTDADEVTEKTEQPKLTCIELPSWFKILIGITYAIMILVFIATVFFQLKIRQLHVIKKEKMKNDSERGEEDL